MDSTVTLDDEIFLEDAYKIADWLENDVVTRYISEGKGVGREIKRTINIPPARSLPICSVMAGIST